MAKSPKKAKEIVKKKSLPALAEWGIKTVRLFNQYLKNYERVPATKKILTTMIKFEEMYEPIPKRHTYADALGLVAGENEYRQIKRIQIYLKNRDILGTYDSTQGRKLVVTSTGHKIFYKEYPLAKLRKKKWDGIWTLVVYDFPEKMRRARNRLRRKLISLGFGGVQLSLFISPLPLEDDVQKLIEGKSLERFVWVLRAEGVLGIEDAEVAKLAWPLEELNFLYTTLIKALPLAKEEERLLTQWKRYFLAVNTADPYLPFDLLPEDWQGLRCEKKLLKLSPLGFFRALFR